MAGKEHLQIPAEKLVELCSRSAYTLDGLWFTLIEERFGLETALEIDTEVWRRLCLVQARRLPKYFPIREANPIRQIIKLIELDPLWAIFKPRVIESSDHRAVVRFTDCPPQKARVRDRRGEFPCKPVGFAMFNSYAEVVDSKVKVSCLTCPPDAHPAEYWCEWQIEI